MASSSLIPAVGLTGTAHERTNTPKPSAQATPRPPTSGLLDLESELTCSICTEILYQPLTLLDCLHTFCGSCLKEWFSWQEAAAKQKRRQEGRSSSTQNVFTCPSCRASVRDTRPNSTVTTLLDMYLKANPTRAKSEEEKKEILEHFKVGESVLPSPPSPPPAATGRRRRDADDEDRRLVEEVRQMSLRELERTGTRTSRREGSMQRDERNRRREEMIGSNSAASEQLATSTSLTIGANDHSAQPPGREQVNTSSLEHQSSLRSLINSSDLNSQDMEEEIMRQILEEGLLDGIDLSNIDRNEEDEISERIAQAYRRRQRDRARERDAGARRHRTEGSAQDAASRDSSSGPPSAYHPDASTATTPDLRRGPRSSSQGSGNPAPASQQRRTTIDDTSRPAARSSTDGPGRTETTAPSERRHRRGISQDQHRTALESSRSYDGSRATPHAAPMLNNSSSGSHAERRATQSSSRGLVIPAQPALNPRTTSNTNNSQTIVDHSQEALARDASSHGRTGLGAPTVAPFRYCFSCTKPRIQHEVHYTCLICPPLTGSNTFALCRRCYRSGKGCAHWYGFGETNWTKFQHQLPQDDHSEAPHFLLPERYAKISDAPLDDNFPSYHETGVFCDICSENANTCYWRCGVCNEGEWGFCNTCVNQARHCTHPLLPLAYDTDNNTALSRTTITASTTVLPVHTSCNVCSNPIPPSNTRFHCPSCNEGDYDICTPCYRSFVSSGKISSDDGPHGWRKCEQGHRMLIVGFESRPEGQLRIVLESVVGGWQMRDEDTRNSLSSREISNHGLHEDQVKSHSHWSWRDTASGSWKYKKRPTAPSVQDASNAIAQRVPPSGGFGFKMTALWTRMPDEGIDDELMFPRWAEISEVLNINEDWCWGVYCKKGGLFPAAFGQALR